MSNQPTYGDGPEAAGRAAAARAIRLLTIDALEASTTGHPGMPMGMADLGALLYGEILRHQPRQPDWIDRDRFVLSAGHGSMLLYALLHLSGYGLPLEEIKRLRRIGSLTPGHPEYGHTVGVEMTTGPLGAGLATAVGMAMAERMTGARFNTPVHRIIDHHTYVVSGDGCLMEGISSEAASLAGHHRLGKLIVFYDSNEISIEGHTNITFTEDVAGRFEAYGWQVLRGSAHDADQMMALTESARSETEKPSLIILRSVIGMGSPAMAGTHKIHGTRLGPEQAAKARVALGAPDGETMFYVPPEAYDYFTSKMPGRDALTSRWEETFAAWTAANPELRWELDTFLQRSPDAVGNVDWPVYAIGDAVSGRDAGGAALTAAADALPGLVGGAADLSASCKTELPAHGDFTPENPRGKTIRFGVREHAMASIANGLALHGGFRPFAATIVIFADYMKPAMRLSAIMGLPVIYVLTHDSIFMGGDGPTHQPIEQFASLRIIPNMRLLRPGDPEEAVEAWKMALERTDGPTSLIFSRQALTTYAKPDGWKETVRQRGAYVVREPEGPVDVTVFATGSEVGMALQAAESATGVGVRVVSVMSRELLTAPGSDAVDEWRPDGVRGVAVEAACGSGWEAVTRGDRGAVLSLDGFGLSGRPEEVAEALGFTVSRLTAMMEGRR